MARLENIVSTLRSRVMGGDKKEKERSVFMGFLFGLIGLFPAIAVVILTGSVTQLSDLLKNISLVLAVFLSWVAVRRVARGETPNYNYGYGKLENLSSLIVAAMMIASIAIILQQTIGRLQRPESMGQVGVGIGVLFSGLAAIVNAWMWRQDRGIARKQSSPVMESLWRLDRVKTLSALCVFVSLGSSLALRNYSWSVYVDPAGSFVLLGFLGYSAYGVVSMSVYDLLDRTLEESLQLVILQELAAYFDKYEAIHGIRSRRVGGRVYIELLLEFDGDQKMVEVQSVIDSIKAHLEQKMPGSRVVVVPTTAAIA